MGSTRYLQVLLWVRGDATLSRSDASHMENAGRTSKEMVECFYTIHQE